MVTLIAKQLIRNFKKDRIHLLFNLLGLSFGLTASILVLLYIQQVLSFDKFHVNNDRLYWFGVTMTIGSSPASTQEGCNPGTGPILKQAIPGIEEFVRTLALGNTRVIIGENIFNEPSLNWADNSIFKVFTFPLLQGNKETALERPKTIVIAQDLALKYFGTTDVLGKTVKIENTGDFEITGVLKELPKNSIFNFSGLLSMVTIQSVNPGDYKVANFSSNMDYWLFFLFDKGFTQESFNIAFKKWYKEFLAPVDMINFEAVVEPFKDIYLNSVVWPYFSQSNRMVLTGFISIGILLLVLACINYINLTTSRAEERAKEIGVRKISGANQKSLRIQLIAESIITIYISMAFALVLTEFLLKFTNISSLIGIELILDPFKNSFLLISIILIPLIVGFLSGFYPAFLMSKMTPVSVIKTARGGTTGKSFLRMFLIIFQFTISIGALILSILMTSQIKRIRNIDPGFDKNNLIYITCTNQSVKPKFKIYREKISNYPDIKSTSFSNVSPGFSHIGFALNWESENGKMEPYPAVEVRTDNDFFKTLRLKIEKGSGFFKPRLPTDTILYFVVNETFVKSLGWKDPIGKLNSQGKTIGVIRDYYYGSMTYPLRPMYIVQYREDRIPDILNVRMGEEKSKTTIDYLKQTWKEIIPEVPFEFTYAADAINTLYLPIKNQGIIINWLAMICLLISCFGLLSYSSYIAFRKKRDFVIRKVFGATSLRIFSEFSVIILKIMLISSVIANLLAFIAYDIWSKNFAVKPPLNIWIFIWATLGMLLLAIITTAYHVTSAARTNPVDNLANE